MFTIDSITTRDMQEEDINFIYSTWLKSYRQSDYCKTLSNDVFFLNHKEIISVILNNSNTKVTIICDKEDPDQIYGYIVAEIVKSQTILHFIYVKYNFRKFGIMKHYLQEFNYLNNSVNFITHLPRHYPELKKKYGLEFNPYLLFSSNFGE